MNPTTYIVGPTGLAYYLCEIEVFPIPRRFLFACPILGNGRLDVQNERLAANFQDPFLKKNASDVQNLLRSMWDAERQRDS